ncbi:hypothetical protein DFA_11675 [Cavenderia fasciculata]|uniref:Uncharacterized protein n=1 Tax=Cavenderia fasciculata TaxID=261658 RepID=F4QDW7_CACFS|nr:uncharacterized protein DFA_11675 [Cavenderia fasciculata]EGG13914.1 hypothetical protein DFA_11675 [Cavenderia fasciculata]|eukprot:XP_004350622.1 hypothetical protein DFA_11675 [Cavenderia fasciculata]
MSSSEEQLINSIKELNLPFPYRCTIEYYKLSMTDTVVRPLIVVGVDRSLSEQERSLVPRSIDGITVQMEYTTIVDPSPAQLLARQQQQKDQKDNGVVDILEEQDMEDDDDDDDDDEEDEEDEMDE